MPQEKSKDENQEQQLLQAVLKSEPSLIIDEQLLDPVDLPLVLPIFESQALNVDTYHESLPQIPTCYTQETLSSEETIIISMPVENSFIEIITLSDEYQCQESLKVWNTESRARLRSHGTILRSNEKEPPIQDDSQIKSVASKPPKIQGFESMGTRTTRSNTGYSLSARSKQSGGEATKELVDKDGKTIIVQKRKTPGGRKSMKKLKESPMAPLAKAFEQELKKKMEKEIAKAWDWKN